MNKLKYINMSSRKWCSYWYVLIFIIFDFKVRSIYRKLMAFFREVIFYNLIRMILRQKSRNQFYSWYWNPNMNAVVAQKNWLSPFVMSYLAFPGWTMTLSKRQYEYLNQQVILFRLKYEIHSLQMHPKSPCRSVVSPTPKLSDQRYALRLVVVTCRYFPVRHCYSNPFRHLRRPTSLLLPSRISSSALLIPVVPHLCHRDRPPMSSPLTLSAIPIIPERRYALGLVVVPCHEIHSLQMNPK